MMAALLWHVFRGTPLATQTGVQKRLREDPGEAPRRDPEDRLRDNDGSRSIRIDLWNTQVTQPLPRNAQGPLGSGYNVDEVVQPHAVPPHVRNEGPDDPVLEELRRAGIQRHEDLVEANQNLGFA